MCIVGRQTSANFSHHRITGEHVGLNTRDQLRAGREVRPDQRCDKVLIDPANDNVPHPRRASCHQLRAQGSRRDPGAGHQFELFRDSTRKTQTCFGPFGVRKGHGIAHLKEAVLIKSLSGPIWIIDISRRHP